MINKSVLWKNKLSKEAGEQLESIPYLKSVFVFGTINILSMVFVLFIRRNLPPEIPLFYGLAEKENQLTPPSMLLVPNTLALLFMLINILIIMFIKNDFLKKALVMSGFAVTTLATVTTVKIVFLVGSF